ncbi:hypothetical protein AURDEDRAFT_165666 [Auricularia subglabra TFB-10046 SS5]|nr:hypothetical protein AURDEDRAFT_165666 [Auricularia subglabra TFB-10046 SS5]
MSPAPTTPSLHPDFKDDEDVSLVSSDGLRFNISSSHLIRTSGFYASMFALPQPSTTSAKPFIVAVPETALTLEVILRLALGLPAPLDRLTSLSDIDAAIEAAGKYDMPGPGEVLRQILRGHLTAPLAPPLHQFAVASCYGWDDIVDALFPRLVAMELDFKDIPPAHAQTLARLVSARQERVKTFFTNIKAAHDAALFAKENNGKCRGCGRTLSSGAAQVWHNFVNAMCLSFCFVPSDTEIALPLVTHPDFADDANVTLVAATGTRFRIDSAHLVRTSGVFQDFFVLPREQIVDQDIALPEDELTLDVLLKLALGLPAALDRLSLLGVQRALYAVKKYAMLGATDILERELCTHVDASAMEVYVFASAHGCQKAADKALDRLIRSSIDFKDIPDGHGLARLICRRSERIRLFNDHLRSRATGSAFARENAGVCCHCAQGEQHDSSVWGKLQLAASVRFSDTPAVDAVFAHPDVITFAEQLEKLKCASCGLCAYSWLKIQASLRDLAKCIDAGSPPPM